MAVGSRGIEVEEIDRTVVIMEGGVVDIVMGGIRIEVYSDYNNTLFLDSFCFIFIFL